jgi:hypothetical protein
MAALQGVRVSGVIVPTDSLDTFACIDPFWGIDGLRSVVDHVARNAITLARRRQGMLCYTQNDGVYWQLQAPPWNLTDSDWLLLSGFGGTITLVGDAHGSGITNIVTTVTSYNGGTPFGTMAAQNASSVAITGGTITGMGLPIVPSDVANKAYVDMVTAGLTFIPPGARVATTGALTATYANGTLGVGATLTNSTTQAAISIDGGSLSVNDVVVVKNQAAQAQNGFYKVTTVGSGATNWVLTRLTNYDETSEIVAGSYTAVGQGTVNAATLWIMTAATPITVGTSPITFSQLNITGSGTVTNIATGAGLTGGPITSTGTIAFAAIANNRLLANISGGSLAPSANTLTAIIDSVIASTQGGILYRNATVWTILAPGMSGQFLQTQGGSSNVQWADAAAGTLTQINTGAGLTGGPITSTGTIALATIADQRVFANVSGGAAVPVANTLSDVLDISSTTQGVILYRGASGWLSLTPGMSGQILTTQGAGQDPTWATAGSTGTVTNIATGTGLTGGPITSTGTIAFATITNNRILANVSGGTAAPTPNTLSAILDIAGSTQGDILYRNATTWVVLPPGTSGNVLTTQGGAANPAWVAPTTGSVTNIATGAGLTGGPITSTGTIAFAAIADQRILANVSGGSLAPSATTLSAVLDIAGTAQGDILYRGASTWTVLAPGTSGQVLSTQGGGQNPQWVNASPATTTLTTDVSGSGSGTISVTVVAINGVALGSTVATAGNILIGSGTQWVSHAVSGDTTMTSTGVVTIANNAITTAKIINSAVTYAKIQNVGALSILGNPTGSSAAVSEITLGTGLAFSGTTLTATGSGGTVTNFSFVNANGLVGTVTNPTTIPQLTVGTSITGMIKGNGTSFLMAIPNVDYLTGNLPITLGGAVVGTGTTGATPITTTFGPINGGFLLANASIGGTAAPAGYSLSFYLDRVLGADQGDIMYRDSSGWTALTPGTSGNFLKTQGAGANPIWAAGAGGSVTSVGTGAGLTGGPITSTGTIALAAIADQRILANVSGGSLAPSATTLSAVLDIAGTAQGDILYRGASTWTVLAPGTSGNVLTTQGASANPIWAGAVASSGPRIFTWILGVGVDLVAANDITNWQICSKGGTITRVDLIAKTAPVGASIVIDILKASSSSSPSFTSLWNVTPANRPTITTGNKVGTFGTPDTTTFSAGDILRIDIISVGSGTAGQNLTVELMTSMTN